MKTKASRLCIYPKDVQLITGKSYKQSRLLLKKVKIHFGKSADQFVSVPEFCDYTGLSLEEVSALLNL